MNRYTFYIDNLHSEHQLDLINFRTKKLGHNCNVSPNLSRKEITVTCMEDCMEPEIIANALSSIGFKAKIKTDQKNKTQIQSREDVSKLVHSFYSKIRKDDLLGPIFNSVIPDENWPAHLEKMIDFWEMNLLLKPIYRGNPPMAHIRVDNHVGNEISQAHFDEWLKLWGQTLDENFEGDLALEARKRARMIAKVFLMKILIARGDGFQVEQPF